MFQDGTLRQELQRDLRADYGPALSYEGGSDKNHKFKRVADHSEFPERYSRVGYFQITQLDEKAVARLAPWINPLLASVKQPSWDKVPLLANLARSLEPHSGQDYRSPPTTTDRCLGELVNPIVWGR
jgi:hypothetical protein